MYYVNLSNLGFCKPEDADPTDCDPQSDNTDTSFVDAITGKTVDFLNVQRGNFWFGTEFSSGDAWRLGFGVGDQYPGTKTYEFFAWPVRVGDVAAAPLPSTAVLMALGMLGLGAFRVFWRTT